jgi:hypothetical protein
MADCEECGLAYLESEPSNTKFHRYIYDRRIGGPRTTLPDGIYFLNPTSSYRLRHLAQGAAQIAERETNDELPSFTVREGLDPRHEPELAFRVVDNRVIGLIVTRLRPCTHIGSLDAFVHLDGLGWRPAKARRVPRLLRRTIDMIWVAKAHRRGGDIAWALVEAITGHCGIAVGDLAHSLPFTEAAVRFWTKRGLTDVYLG